MKNSKRILKGAVIFGYVLGLLGSIGGNLALMRANKELLMTYQQLQNVVLLPTGALLRPLHAKDRMGSEVILNYKTREKRTVLMVLGPSCPICEDNWPNWSRIISSVNPDVADIVALDLSSAATDEYIRAHALDRVTLLDAIDPNSMLEHRLRLTPTTVLVNAKGYVEGSWLGVLDDSAMKQLIAGVTRSAS